MRKLLIVLSFGLIAFAGCQTYGDTQTADTAGATGSGDYGTSGSGTSASSGTYGSASSSSRGQVHVMLTEYRIDMPDSLPAGRTIFHVMNHGRIPHSFGIQAAGTGGTYGGGSGYDRRLAADLASGQTATLEVDLQPGSYTAYCPVGNHISTHGMTRQVTVR